MNELDLFKLYPIIGEVNTDCAVILMVTTRKIELTMIINNKKKIKIVTNINKPTRIQLNGLKQYSINTLLYIYNNQIVYTQKFNTKLPKKLAFISCDNPDFDTKCSLWKKLANEDIELLLHLGDNVYEDREYIRGKNLLKKDDSKNSDDIIYNEYKEKYHTTWSKWNRLMKNTSHLMIPDDHEITDNYQSFTEFEKENGRIAKIGLKTLFEYQFTLLSDKIDRNKQFCITKKLDNFVLYMCTRIFIEDPPIDQEIINDILDSAKNTKILILAFSSAPLFQLSGFIGNKLNKLYSKEANWTVEKLTLLYDSLFKWMEYDDNRQVYIVGGDIHLGCEAEIISGNKSIPIYISTPITYQPTPIVGWLYTCSLKGTHTMGKYQMNVKKTRSRRNYLTLDINNPNDLKWKLNYSKYHLPKNPCKVVKNFLGIKNKEISGE